MKQNIETRYLALPLTELRIEEHEDSKAPVIRGYAVVYNSLSEDLGGFRERIKPGAFTQHLQDGADVRALVDHNSTLILGRNTAGTLRISPNQKGLLVEIDPPDTQAGRDIQTSLKRGDVDGMSFAFQVEEDEWHNLDGMAVRDVVAGKIFDVSVVTYPAYAQTSVVALRRLEQFQQWQAEQVIGTPRLNIARRKLKLIGEKF